MDPLTVTTTGTTSPAHDAMTALLADTRSPGTAHRKPPQNTPLPAGAPLRAS